MERTDSHVRSVMLVMGYAVCVNSGAQFDGRCARERYDSDSPGVDSLTQQPTYTFFDGERLPRSWARNKSYLLRSVVRGSTLDSHGGLYLLGCNRHLRHSPY